MPMKPRNPLVAPALLRKAGAHDKPNKAKRRAEKAELQRRLANLLGKGRAADSGFCPA